MANNYTPSYNQYLTQTAGYALPSSVRTYSAFDPSSNSWRRMTNDGRSPMQQGTQADIQAALRLADSSQGKVWDNPAPAQPMVQTQTPGILLRPRTPAQAPAQIPLGSSSRPSVTFQPRTNIPPRGLKVSDATSETLGLDIPRGRAFAQSGQEAGTLSLGLPTNIQQVKPATTQAPTPVVAVNPANAKVNYGTPDSLPTTFVETTYTPPASTLRTAFNNSPVGLALALTKKGYREAKPYVINATDTALKYADDATRKASNTLNQWHTGFLNWLNN